MCVVSGVDVFVRRCLCDDDIGENSIRRQSTRRISSILPARELSERGGDNCIRDSNNNRLSYELNAGVSSMRPSIHHRLAPEVHFHLRRVTRRRVASVLLLLTVASSSPDVNCSLSPVLFTSPHYQLNRRESMMITLCDCELYTGGHDETSLLHYSSCVPPSMP